MRITFDEGAEMGYIYLAPRQPLAMLGAEKVSKEDAESVRQLGELSLSYVQRLQQATHNYNEALRNGELFEWYFNDKDEKGYITGIEFDMSQEDMDYLQEHVAVGFMNWDDVKYDVLLLDDVERAFSPDNVLYAMSDARDVYVVLRMVRSGHFDITAVLSARAELYPPAYWTLPIYCVFSD